MSIELQDVLDSGDITGATIASGTLTASDPALNITQTWNNAAVTFTAAKLNVTNTTSASGSLLMDLQLGGTSKLFFNSDAHNSATVNYIGSPSSVGISGTSVDINVGSSISPSTTHKLRCNTTGVILKSDYLFGWAEAEPYSTIDVKLYRDAAGTLALRNSTNAQAFNIYNTYTDASNYERLGVYWSSNTAYIRPQKAGTGSARNMYIGDGTNAGSVSIDSSFLTTFYNAGTAVCGFGGTGLAFESDGSFDKFINFRNKGSDTACRYLAIDGQSAYSSAVTNIAGGAIYIRAGSGASGSAGAAHGGSLYIQAGVAYGTGVSGTVSIARAANKLGFFETAAITQYATTGTTTGFTSATGSTVLSGSTFTGNTGSTAYTIGDIVRALKLYGLLAS
jgi:hypothetical protein